MRIIAGKYRHRKIASLPGDATRPMLDRMRETLFNVLQGRIEGRIVADLYAGTGAVGLEALSRSAARAIFVEVNPRAADVIRKNVADLAAEKDVEIRMTTVEQVLPKIEADVYFVTPPYPDVKAYETTLTALAQKDHELVVVQHDRDLELLDAYGDMEKFRVVPVGSNRLSLYQRVNHTEPVTSPE